jgi:hypothetical protein
MLPFAKLFIGITVAQCPITEKLIMGYRAFGARGGIVAMIGKSADFHHRRVVCNNSDKRGPYTYT